MNKMIDSEKVLKNFWKEYESMIEEYQAEVEFWHTINKGKGKPEMSPYHIGKLSGFFDAIRSIEGYVNYLEEKGEI